MDQRQFEKERIRLTREIAMLENQLASAIKGKEEKLEENKAIREEIAILEEENKALEEETRRLDEEIASLDDEFKAAQIEAGRLRREIKINTERAESEHKKSAALRTEIAKMEKELELLRREIKSEIDQRRTLETRLRQTNAQIDAMKSHKLAQIVTRNLEKQDWYKRVEEPDLTFDDGEFAAPPSEPPAAPAENDLIRAEDEKKEEKPKSEGGIDFGVD